MDYKTKALYKWVPGNGSTYAIVTTGAERNSRDVGFGDHLEYETVHATVAEGDIRYGVTWVLGLFLKECTLVTDSDPVAEFVGDMDSFILAGKLSQI